MHNHEGCQHKLEFCKKCDTVYCEKCSSEWKKNYTWTSGYVTTITPGYTTGYLTPCNNSVTNGSTVVAETNTCHSS